MTDSLTRPAVFPGLKKLDSLLKCGICYEYMNTAMVTACSHNYCSLCIRKSLTYKQQCPTCFEETHDTQLRNNRLIDEIITVFMDLKDDLVACLATNRTSSTKYHITKEKTPVKEHLRQNLFPTTSTTSFTDDEQDDFQCVMDHSIPVHHAAQGTSAGSSSACSPKKRALSPQTQPSSILHEQTIPAMFSPTKKKPNTTKVMVPCPVCNVDIPEKYINLHLDACLKREDQDSIRSARRNHRKPLPKLVYSLLQEKELRKKLKDHGLSTQGDRKTLIQRHQRFTLLYNCECDSEHPRPVADIVLQVEKEEREERKVSTSTVGGKLQVDRKADIKEIEEAQKQYLMENKASFENLIQSIKKQNFKKPQVPGVFGGEDVIPDRIPGCSVMEVTPQTNSVQVMEPEIFSESEDAYFEPEKRSSTFTKNSTAQPVQRPNSRRIEIIDENSVDEEPAFLSEYKQGQESAKKRTEIDDRSVTPDLFSQTPNSQSRQSDDNITPEQPGLRDQIICLSTRSVGSSNSDPDSGGQSDVSCSLLEENESQSINISKEWIQIEEDTNRRSSQAIKQNDSAGHHLGKASNTTVGCVQSKDAEPLYRSRSTTAGNSSYKSISENVVLRVSAHEGVTPKKTYESDATTNFSRGMERSDIPAGTGVVEWSSDDDTNHSVFGRNKKTETNTNSNTKEASDASVVSYSLLDNMQSNNSGSRLTKDGSDKWDVDHSILKDLQDSKGSTGVRLTNNVSMSNSSCSMLKEQDDSLNACSQFVSATEDINLLLQEEPLEDININENTLKNVTEMLNKSTKRQKRKEKEETTSPKAVVSETDQKSVSQQLDPDFQVDTQDLQALAEDLTPRRLTRKRKSSAAQVDNTAEKMRLRRRVKR